MECWILLLAKRAILFGQRISKKRDDIIGWSQKTNVDKRRFSNSGIRRQVYLAYKDETCWDIRNTKEKLIMMIISSVYTFTFSLVFLRLILKKKETNKIRVNFYILKIMTLFVI
jgi:hypothetical protein